MPRISVRDFSGGWWAMGTKDENPPSTLRRAKGVSPLKTKSIVSRWGSTQLFDLNAHSLFRFAGLRFQGAGTQFYREGVSIKAGLSGARLTAVRMPPGPGIADSLFVAGGGTLFKVDQLGNVSGWGIESPSDGFTAAVSVPKSRTIDDFESAASWTATDTTLADEATIKQVGSKSMKMTTAAGAVGMATKALVRDLTVYADNTKSPLEDFITIWVRADNPSNIDNLNIMLDVGNGDFASDYYVFDVASQLPPSSQLLQEVVGIGTIPGFEDRIIFPDPETPTPETITIPVVTSLGTTTIVTAIGAWVRLRIPKIGFNRVGASANTWRDVKAVRLVVRSKGPNTVYWDEMELLGQVGILGSYKYKITFFNSTTGSRSNANPTPVSAEKVMRTTVQLSNLPVPTDPQVDKVEIWRTVGNGTLYFKVDEVDQGTTSYLDRVADFAGLDSTPGVKLLQNTQLPVDNLKPDPTFGFIFGPYQNCMFWCGDSTEGARGRVYYSPIGRPESVTNFLVVTSDDDPTQCGVVWNGSAWVFSKAHLYQIQGDGTVFIYTQVYDVIGTVDPYSVEPTPVGIFYQAKDGLRLFTGIKSDLIGQENLEAIFRGQTIEGVGPFEGVVAAYGKNQYLVSDASGQTLALNLNRATWRYLGVGLNALFYEPETGLTIATLGGKVVILEDNLIESDNGAPIPFEVEIPSIPTSVEHAGLFQRLFLKLNTQGQLLTPTIILDGVETAIPAVSTPTLPGHSGRVIEIPVFRNGLSMGVRLAGSLTKQVEVVEVAADLYISEGVVMGQQILGRMQQMAKPQ